VRLGTQSGIIGGLPRVGKAIAYDAEVMSLRNLSVAGEERDGRDEVVDDV
jgi:hypothetical protein